MKRIAIIPARGGSKRIPKKNIKDFSGKPIIAYSIEAAIKSKMFAEVMVSTDSDEISDIAKKYGAKVPFLRSEGNSDDHATIQDVIIEVINEYEKMGMLFDEIMCIYPTSPFVTSEKISAALDMLTEDVDMVIPVVQYSYPPQRAFVIREGKAVYQFEQYVNSRSQDLQPIYHDCGQFFAVHKDGVNKPLDERIILPLIVSELEVQDIDTETDWNIAEMKYQLFLNKLN